MLSKIKNLITHTAGWLRETYRTCLKLHAVKTAMPEMPAMVTCIVDPQQLIHDDLEIRIRKMIEKAKPLQKGNR